MLSNSYPASSKARPPKVSPRSVFVNAVKEGSTLRFKKVRFYQGRDDHSSTNFAASWASSSISFEFVFTSPKTNIEKGTGREERERDPMHGWQNE